MSTYPSTPQLFQDLLAIGEFHSRRFLLHDPLNQPPAAATTSSTAPRSSHDPSEPYPDRAFDANVVMVLSVLLCALICSLGLNSIIRCALRCSSLVATPSEPPGHAPANTGVKKKALKIFPTVSYSSDLKLPGLDTECVICLSEFTNGERVKLLPKCNHGFHVRCIDKWLSSHSSCPTCRHCLIETCQKIVGCSEGQAAGSSSSLRAPPLLQEIVVVSIAPLEPEDLVRNYRGILADNYNY